jgi:predicted transcriptional regulator
MDVRVTAALEKRLTDLAAKTGREPAELLEDAIPYLEELAGVRETLDSRYDDLKSGRVTPIDGETFFESLREREDERLKRSPQ